MSKLLAIFLTLTLLLSAGISAAAEDGVTVYVTISDGAGNLALAQEPITVTDTDADGQITLNDALVAAHEAKYSGGAAAGYAASASAYGISLEKLWGAANGGSYGYCVNDQSALSLSDPVKNGDRVSAYVFTDLTAWSDTYCYFDTPTATAKAGETVTLTLSAAGYDANFNPIVLPVTDATITLNDKATAFTTDEEGKVSVTFENAGTFVISATCASMNLVPPVCKAAVTAETVATKPATPTGDAGSTAACVTAFTAFAAAVLLVKRGRSYEQ